MKDIRGTAVYIDDILITGGTTDEHLQNLEATLTRLETAGLRLKKSKCSFSSLFGPCD